MFLLWILRFFMFHLYESPKYLMGRGRDAEAIEVVKKVAVYNGRAVTDVKVTEEDLKEVGKLDTSGAEGRIDTSVVGVVKRRVRAVFGAAHLEGLFKTKKLAYSTSLLVVIWGELRFLRFTLSYASCFTHSVDRLGVPSVSPSHVL
jgi:hypothetical protein